ncbi:MAG: hypothetical protein JXR88_05265 [Clostridia bacterium]|nr:hypothetical protein [Clostridia bacterium]
MRRKIIALVLFAVTGYILWLNHFATTTTVWPMYDHIVEYGFLETQSKNLVTAIYLNYRYYDTLFEALLLIISVIAVIYLSVHEENYHE